MYLKKKYQQYNTHLLLPLQSLAKYKILTKRSHNETLKKRAVTTAVHSATNKADGLVDKRRAQQMSLHLLTGVRWSSKTQMDWLIVVMDTLSLMVDFYSYFH